KLSIVCDCEKKDPNVRRRVLCYVPLDRTYLFEMRLKHFVIGKDLTYKDINRCTRTASATEPHDHNVYTLNLQAKVVSKVLAQLNACLGSHHSSRRQFIDTVSITECLDKTSRDDVRKLLEGFTISRLQYGITMSDEEVKFINDLIDNHKVETLVISVEKVNLKDPAKALLSFSAKVHRLNFIQHITPEIPYTASYMFGLHNAEWGKIITDMMGKGKKLDTFRIHNNYSNWLSTSNEETIIRSLPKLGKKLWFNTSRDNVNIINNRHVIDVKNFKDNEHDIQVTRSSVSIVHSSRRFERFLF
ncbi:hypothetical protein PMAYCL1PPCAC_20525, partial [Pristionchus mayeri]